MALKTVVVVSDYAYTQGGASKVAIDTAIGLATAGRNVVFFSAVGPADSQLAGAGVEVENLRQFDILSNPSRLKAMVDGIWNEVARRRLSHFLRLLNPNETVIHIHQWTKALSPSIFAADGIQQYPVVISVHDYFLICPSGLYIYPHGDFCPHRPMSVECILCNCDVRNYGHKLWRVARQGIQDAVLSRRPLIQHFIFPSAYVSGLIQPLIPAFSGTSVVCPPIASSLGPRVRAEANQEILFIGRLSKEKGPNLFASAAELAGVKATFVGDGYERAAITSSFPHAEVTGWIDSVEVEAWYRQARAVVFPTMCHEGQPLTILEAASFGIPAIVSAPNAASAGVRDGVDGLHFRRGNVRDLAQQLRKVASDALVANLSANAYARFWAEPPTLNTYIARLDKIYALARVSKAREPIT
jgi:glycosyltransferase involved in cell wall biosynthesis